MPRNWTADIETVDNAFRENGRQVTLRPFSYVGSGQDKVKTAGTDVLVYALQAQFENKELGSQTGIDSRSIVQAGDSKEIVSAKDLSEAPGTAWHLIDSADTYEIVSIGILSPGGVDIMYTLHCRKA